ncbi:hypothetical protein HHI36_012143 [Cryptolaemus montrouzieri]|uniref:Uncharacterized protein n=1 Tax=Cryptolaemus montrouzieri TaxID=559131 RepID=A0ABD2NEX4_9CUCU
MLRSEQSKKLINGLFIGLAHLSERLQFDPIKEKQKIEDLYSFIKKLTEAAANNRIKTYCRASLIFLQKNIVLFKDYIFNDHKFWHSTLIKWLSFEQLRRKFHLKLF